MEMEILDELGKINQSIQHSSIGIRAVLSNEEVFIIKLAENIDTIKTYRNRHSHLLSKKQMNSINKLIADYSKIQSEAKQFKSSNTTYCQGQYPCYDNLSEVLLTKAKEQVQATETFFVEVRKDILKMAGR